MSMVGMFNGVKAKYATSTLIEALKGYKQQHLVEYKDALDVYRVDLHRMLKNSTKQFKNKYNDISKFEMPSIPYAPKNVADSYDKLINIFLNLEGDQIELDASQANCILNNDWDWVKQASVSNSFYTSRK